ncbi:MAG: MBL fold metallo-hydrolase [Clostridiales Family XIII bacterium]|jgi:glyoxylase-like metal-dependent hydrolase (beta-lactamase superfamily II)|nr:MBL fold metallo-hydrolase [Clostridiales Family XIII bacterium]
MLDTLATIPVAESPGTACFLLLSENGAFLADTGYAFGAEAAAQNIARALGGRPLDCILLTHSHFDHVGGLSVMKRHWPDAKVIAHPRVKEILARQSARALMRALDDDTAKKCGAPAAGGNPDEDPVPDMCAAREGDVLRIGGASIRVMEMPSHTKCSVSYHFQEDDLFVLNETAGVKLKTGEAVPAFVLSYKAALEAIARTEKTAPRRMLISHLGEISGEDVTQYLKDARAAARAAAELVLTRHRKGESPDAILDACTERFYVGSLREYQPVEIFQSNMRAMIPRLIAETEAEADR